MTTFYLPKLAISMREGTLAEWLAEDGAGVVEGQPVYAVEAEKATMEVLAPASGVLRRMAEKGQVLAVGAAVGAIEPNGANADSSPSA